MTIKTIRQLTYRMCPICGKEFQSLEYARHMAMHADPRERMKILEDQHENIMNNVSEKIVTKTKYLTGLIKATEEQLASIGIDDVPTGALVQLREVNKYITPYGPGSKMIYKYKTFNYIIPTKWVAL